MCKSCSSSKKEVKSESGICKAVDEQCVDSLCNDLCLGDAIWTCKVVGKGEWSGRVSDAESKALCAQVKGKACSEQAKCCALGEDPQGLKSGKDAVFNGLREWVVSQSGGGEEAGNSFAAFLTGALPLQMCRHDAMDADQTDLRCASCSSGLVLKLEMVSEKPESACRSFVPMAASGEPPADEDGSFQSLYDRCLKVHTHLLSVRNDAASFFSDSLCKCAGCCTKKPTGELGTLAECPFPTYSIL